MSNQTSTTPEITLPLVIKLIAEQFPRWAHLPIKPVEFSGSDNRMFRLSEEMVIRLPSAQRYAAKVEIEQKWLPILAPHLPVLIPKPIAMGKPSNSYPWNWSIYKWIEGQSANALLLDDLSLNLLASDLANFLKALHKIDIAHAPIPGPHNFYRGAAPKVYDSETKAAIIELRDLIDVDAVTSVWQRALNSKWTKKPVWIHGDLSSGNILLKNNRLVAVIDWGGMAVGDPACDLVISYTYLKNESRKIFREQLGLDDETWARPRGWALWKALITIAPIKDRTCLEAIRQLKIIKEIIMECEIEYTSFF